MELDPDDIEALHEVVRAWRGRAPLDFVSTFDTADLASNRPEDYRLLDAALAYAIGSAPLLALNRRSAPSDHPKRPSNRR